ncbi:MAG TPA: ABC transporter permease [Chloroflexi bacterium]|nr:ABC transporter permease [Chloroflexota bacterium]HAF19126.1 ABC transporter permease [Chloroflexota bacterium]
MRRLPSAPPLRNSRSPWPAVLLLSPALLFVVVFIAFPLGSEVWFSLSNAQVGEIGSFVGLSNFVYLVQQSTYHDALVNTFVYAVVGIGAKAILGMALAFALARQFRGRRVVYALIFLPFIFPTVTGTMAWYYLFSNVHGAINYALMAWGLSRDGIDWLGSFGPLPMTSLITVNVWHGVGLFVVLLLAGLRSIPPEVLDSALVDGARSWQRFVHVILPLLRPAFALAAVLSIMGTFGDFAIIHILTNGGPANHTQTITHMAFQVALRDGDLGTSAAIAFSLMPVYLIAVAYMLRTVVSE